MLPTPYPELNQVLDALVSRLRDTLRDHLVGVYLQGSFAVGDFDEHSDVDFVVAIQDELPPGQVDDLQHVHDQIYHIGLEWAKHLEGSYFPLETLREQTRRGTELWYLDNGARSLIRADHCNTLLVRWVVREKGVVLVGPPPKTLVDPIPVTLLREEMLNTITGWGQEILDNPARYGNRFYQGFILLSYCRMLHDLRRGFPGSKRQGAEWAKSTFGSTWSALIDRAWATRPDPARSVREPANPEDLAQTLRFVELVIAESRRFMDAQ
jgi:predicted nucleotidyltransferase